MDYLQEAICLALDSVVLGILIKEYNSYKSTRDKLKDAPQITINENLKRNPELVANNKIPYVVLRGTVTPLAPPMKSVLAPSVTGVLQVIKLREHRVARGFAGFWTEQKKLIHVSTNDIPFAISNNKCDVEVIDGLSAEILDLDVVYDHYEQTSLSFFDHIFGFFAGVRQKGMQTTEEILRDGSLITAVGELELDGKSLKLVSNSNAPMFLTTATKGTLLKKLDEVKSSMLVKIGICSIIGAVCLGLIIRKIYLKKKQERNERKLKNDLEKSRKERRSKARQNDIPVEQRCVVCIHNPREIILFPCGHVCLCEDCAIQIKDLCPVCRTKIDSKMAAFIS